MKGILESLRLIEERLQLRAPRDEISLNDVVIGIALRHDAKKLVALREENESFRRRERARVPRRDPNSPRARIDDHSPRSPEDDALSDDMNPAQVEVLRLAEIESKRRIIESTQPKKLSPRPLRDREEPRSRGSDDTVGVFDESRRASRELVLLDLVTWASVELRLEHGAAPTDANRS